MDLISDLLDIVDLQIAKGKDGSATDTLFYCGVLAIICDLIGGDYTWDYRITRNYPHYHFDHFAGNLRAKN